MIGPAVCTLPEGTPVARKLTALMAAGTPSVVELHRLSADLEAASQDTTRMPSEVFGECYRLLSRLLMIAAELAAEPCSNQESINSMLAFLQGALIELDAGGEQGDPGKWEAVRSEALERWGNWLALLEYTPTEGPSPTATASGQSTADDEKSTSAEQTTAPSADEVQRLLAALGTPRMEGRASAARTAQSIADRGKAKVDRCSASAAPVEDAIELDHELLAAFLEDTARCLAALEELAMATPADRCDPETVRRACRELHTLKGASASVGLHTVANYLHAVEETFQAADGDQRSAIGSRTILQTVDEVRRRIAALTTRGTPEPKPDSPPQLAAEVAPSRPESFTDSASHIEDTVRIKASQLDRLLDMLAELVMLRNSRESRVSQLKRSNADLVSCVSRLRLADDATVSPGPVRPEGTRKLTELVSDLQEVARGLRELYEPIADENQAVSHFIRQFRQELVQLSRLPLSGLFRRLQRAAHEAASAEGKSVHIHYHGGDIGVDRSLQERLYEPLLHIVRNAVSHGVEDGTKRAAAGKAPQGNITVTARSGTNLLMLEVRDDGAGLDYEAIRRRGVERGLLAAHQATSTQELSQLIFQPGFSTRQAVGKVAGRGVGMDVVAETVHRLRGWIEIESIAGAGSCIRLHVPMRSTIEHAMVFRSHGQIFGIPLTYVHHAGLWQEAFAATKTGSEPGAEIQLLSIGFSQLFFSTDQPARAYAVVLDHRKPSGTLDQGAAGPTSPAHLPGKRQRVALFVDEIVGPEEVVVRPLPPLLRHQPHCSGVTLSGSGETMLLLDGQQLCELALAHLDRDSLSGGEGRNREPGSHEPPVVLAVDDSRSARSLLVRLLKRHGLRVQEATDGVHALEQLRAGRFAAVFSDVEMPRLDGLSLLERLKADPQAGNLPVVMVSSRDEAGLRSRAAANGAVAYLTKPLAESDVSAVLSRLALAAT